MPNGSSGGIHRLRMATVEEDDTMLRMLIAATSECNRAVDFRFSSPAWTVLFRFLRNDAANSKERQDNIARRADLLDLSTERVFAVVEELSRSTGTFEQGSLELRCAIQFFGNLVTNNDPNKHLVWRRISPCFPFLLSCEDPVLIKYSTMLLYNCIAGAPALKDEFLYSHPNSSAIVSLVLRSAADGYSEWGLFAVECFIQSQSFMERCYPCLLPNHRLFVLDVLISMMSIKEERQSRIPFTNIQFIAEAFESRADVIFRANQSVPPEETLEVVRFAEALCAASSTNLYNKELVLLSSLLCCTLFLLKGVHMAEKDLSKEFVTVETLNCSVQTLSDERSSSPIDGLKCSLIRLVANMCWRNRTNQDKIREFDGIPLLLDCCKLDAKNPYIIQWVVYAIRNLCEGNVENQELIGSMEKQGLADSYVKKSESAICGNYSKLQHTKEDILDLFS